MKASPGFLRGFFLLLGILAGIALYIALVLFPIVEDINQLKRDKKDLELQIEDFKQEAHRFFVIDENEKRYIQRESELMTGAIPTVASSSEKNELIQETYRSLHRLAAELNLPDGSISLSGNPISQQEILNEEGEWVFPYSSTYQRFSAKVSAPLPKALLFLNRIPSLTNRYLDIQAVRVTAGREYPSVFISLRCYYCEGSGCEAVDMIEHARKYGVIIDNDADILLERVYWHSEKDIERRTLSQDSGMAIFIKKDN